MLNAFPNLVVSTSTSLTTTVTCSGLNMHVQMNFTLALHNLVHFYLQENQDGDSIIGEFETSKANANNHLSYTVFSVQRLLKYSYTESASCKPV